MRRSLTPPSLSSSRSGIPISLRISPPQLIARIDDPRHADLWRSERVGESDRWFEDAISPQESTARALVHQVFSGSAKQVLLCGDSTLALATLLEIAHRAWEDWGLVDAADLGETQAADPAALAVARAARQATTPHQVERVVLLDRRAEDLRREYRATSPRAVAEALPAVSPRAQTWRDHLLPCLDAMTETEAQQTAVVITDAPTEATMHEAGRTAQLHPDTPVFVLSSDGAGITDTVFDLLQSFQRALLVNNKPPEDTWTRIARHWHECYRLTHPAVPGGRRNSPASRGRS
jgi:hypothetical protein